MQELWADIPGFDSYQISNTGLIRNIRTKNLVKIYRRLASKECNHWRPIVVIRKEGQRKSYTFHLSRLLWEIFKGPIPDGMVIDHIDHNPFNNTWDNLRLCSRQDNVRNRRKSVGKSSKYKGVYTRRNKWVATIVIDRKVKWIGTFDTELEAAKAYDREALGTFKDFSCLNFPDVVNEV